jgi:tetratricopeptide (TPR) repeat protein
MNSWRLRAARFTSEGSSHISREEKLMIRLTRSAAVALGFALCGAVIAPRGAAAQGAVGASCSIEEGSPKEVAQAYLRLNGAAGSTAKDAKLKSLREAVKSASTNMDKGQNIPGRNYIMAKAYSMILQDSILPVVTTRGELGLVGGNAAERVDLVVAVDSLLDTVEKASPDCVTEAALYRQNQAWLNMLNAAIAAVDRNQLDTAETLVNRTLILHDQNPYGYQVLASIHARRGDQAKQMEMWQKVIDVSADDTSHKEVRTQANYYLGNLYAEQAQAASGAEQARLAREAQKLYRAYMTEMGDSVTNDLGLVRSNLAVVLSMSGDSAQIPALYAPLMASPEKYSAADHLAAGDMAARLNRSADAVRLYENVLKHNPNDRKALFNLAASYYAEKQYEKMVPTIHQLVAVDPSHTENWKLLSYAYAMLQSQEKDAAKKKLLTDSILKYQKISDEMTTDVEVVEFAPRNDVATIDGTITNLDPKATKNYTIKFEFLDKAGTVVATKEATVGPVAPNTAKGFKVEVSQPGVVSFRYAPVK